MEAMGCPARQGWWSLQEGKEGKLELGGPLGESSGLCPSSTLPGEKVGAAA